MGEEVGDAFDGIQVCTTLRGLIDKGLGSVKVFGSVSES